MKNTKETVVRASRKPSCGRNTKLIHSILQQYSTFCSSLERDVKNYYFLLYEEYKHDTF